MSSELLNHDQVRNLEEQTKQSKTFNLSKYEIDMTLQIHYIWSSRGIGFEKETNKYEVIVYAYSDKVKNFSKKHVIEISKMFDNNQLGFFEMNKNVAPCGYFFDMIGTKEECQAFFDKY